MVFRFWFLFLRVSRSVRRRIDFVVVHLDLLTGYMTFCIPNRLFLVHTVFTGLASMCLYVPSSVESKFDVFYGNSLSSFSYCIFSKQHTFLCRVN